MTGTLFLWVLLASIAANTVWMLPVLLWWRRVRTLEARQGLAVAVRAVFGRERSLWGRALVFSSSGDVSTHDARAFLRVLSIARSRGMSVSTGLEEEAPRSFSSKAIRDLLEVSRVGGLGGEEVSPTTERGSS